MAPILSHGQTTSGQCGFNQVASHPADPIKRHRARRARSHPKAMLTTQTSAVALDLLENSIDPKRPFSGGPYHACVEDPARLTQGEQGMTSAHNYGET